MNKLVLACVVVGVFAAGCGKNKMVEIAQQYEKDACACKDATCASNVSLKFTQDMSANASSVPTGGGDAESYSKAVSAATQCVTKASSVVPGAK